MIAQSLKNMVAERFAPQRVADVRIGLGYTAVMLADGRTGVAYTFRDRTPPDCSAFAGTRPLAGRTSTELLDYLESEHPVEAAVGLACANALLNQGGEDFREGDLLNVLSVGFLDRVAMVGFFGPLVGPLRKRARELLIFEHDTSRGDGVMPAEEAPAFLPQCEVAVITSTALLLGELDRLLEAARGCREVALVGASTPLAPSVFGPLGVTLLSGVVVTDGPGVLRVVSEGGGMAFFGGHVRKVNVRP